MNFVDGQRVAWRRHGQETKGRVERRDSSDWPIRFLGDDGISHLFKLDGRYYIHEEPTLFPLEEEAHTAEFPSDLDIPKGSPEDLLYRAQDALERVEPESASALWKPKVSWRDRCQELELRIEELTTQNARLAETASQRELALANALVEVETLKQRIKELEGDLQVSKHAASYHQERNNELTNKVLGLTAAVVVLGNRVQ